ncbi:hypothetical protein PSTT_13690 [Puccinia striiformis]|uniref:Uncharacterized protein n=1 Tax=Puccinia striiformis TaxID=27350 RepID=A0A2S4UQR9_9BASI|nr:hypothetical protein PSTT_13690 [Puccinia striiformis]
MIRRRGMRRRPLMQLRMGKFLHWFIIIIFIYFSDFIFGNISLPGSQQLF